MSSTHFNRREFMRVAGVGLTIWSAAGVRRSFADTPDAPPFADRVRGLLIGSCLGDALGGPIEFQPRDQVQRLPRPPKIWADHEMLDAAALAASAARLELRSYTPLRPNPEPYGHWTSNAEPGTVTDDSRHKMVLLHALREARRRKHWPFDRRALARGYLDYPRSASLRVRRNYDGLCADWLEEWYQAARWLLGRRDTPQALPPERMWTGLPTCCGQMTLLPLAAVFAGDPARAYRIAHGLAFFDNGFGKDLNAGLVAGLAHALVVPVTTNDPGPAWSGVLSTLRATDPFAYGRVPWTPRPLDRWLDLALEAAQQAEGRPARLFARLDREFERTIKWEAQVPFVVTFSCLALCRYDPLAALQLSLEWGHDTDSYAQLVGAFVGALHGPQVFPESMRRSVTERLRLDYGESIEEWARLLLDLRDGDRRKPLFRDDG